MRSSLETVSRMACEVQLAPDITLLLHTLEQHSSIVEYTDCEKHMIVCRAHTYILNISLIVFSGR